MNRWVTVILSDKRALHWKTPLHGAPLHKHLPALGSQLGEVRVKELIVDYVRYAGPLT